MGRPRPAVGGSHWHSLDSVPSPGPGQKKYLRAGVPKGVYSVRLLGAKTEIPGKESAMATPIVKHISEGPHGFRYYIASFIEWCRSYSHGIGLGLHILALLLAIVALKYAFKQ